VTRALAAASGALVVSVGYRLAPERTFPVPVDEAVAALRWLARTPRRSAATAIASRSPPCAPGYLHKSDRVG
jgi:acetyl esterase/lipase